MKIKNEILDILGNCKIEGNILYLPDVKLDRADYVEVNKVLENLGGKWDRKAKGHVFDHCPEDELEDVILTGEFTDKKKQYQFFPTPEEIAEQLCDLAEIDNTMFVLEPSCGKGNIADAVYKRKPAYLLGLELNTDMDKYLADKPYETITGADFLQYKGYKKLFDRVVMNPPFTKQQDIDHVMRAYSVLKPNGVLVSVMSTSPFFRTNKKSEEFRKFLSTVEYERIDLPEGAFKESGTMVNTCIVKIRKV